MSLQKLLDQVCDLYKESFDNILSDFGDHYPSTSQEYKCLEKIVRDNVGDRTASKFHRVSEKSLGFCQGVASQPVRVTSKTDNPKEKCIHVGIKTGTQCTHNQVEGDYCRMHAKIATTVAPEKCHFKKPNGTTCMNNATVEGLCSRHSVTKCNYKKCKNNTALSSTERCRLHIDPKNSLFIRLPNTPDEMYYHQDTELIFKDELVVGKLVSGKPLMEISDDDLECVYVYKFKLDSKYHPRMMELLPRFRERVESG